MSLLKAFLIILLIVTVGAASAIYVKGQAQKTSAKLPGSVKIASAEPETITADVHAPNGENNLKAEKLVQSTGNSIYTFYTSDIPETKKTLIFKSALPVGASYTVPANSWSPDNRYLFIKQNTASGSSYLVFNADASKFANGQEYLEVVSGFNSKNNGFTITNITGWDSDTLLHIKAISGEQKANFWYEIPSGAVIRLSS